MLAAITYTCPCGSRYVVALAAGEATATIEAGWRGSVADVAASIGTRYLDGRRPGFVCSSCRRVHVRPPALADGTLLAVSAN